MDNEIIIRCEDSIDSIFSAIYDGFVYKKKIQEQYKDNISIAIGVSTQMNLFSTEIEVETDMEKATRTIDAIHRKLGYMTFNQVMRALCHFDEDRATVVFGYLVRAFRYGPRVNEHLADEYVVRVMELARKVSNEEQRFKGFIRFSNKGDYLFGQIEPKCDVLPIISDHFMDRYPNENFILYDTIRKYALVHQVGKEGFFMRDVEPSGSELAITDEFEKLWKRYFEVMAIDERKNEKCQNNNMPIWYRKNMIEFGG